MKLKVIIHEAEEGGFWAEVPAIPGCVTQGEDFKELIENLYDAVDGTISPTFFLTRHAKYETFFTAYSVANINYFVKKFYTQHVSELGDRSFWFIAIIAVMTHSQKVLLPFCVLLDMIRLSLESRRDGMCVATESRHYLFSESRRDGMFRATPPPHS